ncbi:hypothetical protein Tco_1049402 [Tanacetum coccineum]
MVKEVNELRAERIAKNANPLALVATTQPCQDSYVENFGSYCKVLQETLQTYQLISVKLKGYQSQKEQKQAKTDKKRKRQVQERDLRKVIKAESARQQAKESQ